MGGPGSHVHLAHARAQFEPQALHKFLEHRKYGDAVCAIGSRLIVSDRGDQDFSKIHCVVVAAQAYRGSAVPGAMPVDAFVCWVRSSFGSLATVVIDIPGGSDDLD
jgi:hypothetical protein